MRYLSHEPGKNLSAAERDALFAAGLTVGLVWETAADRALAGFTAGASDAREANAQADALGWPRTTTLGYAVDFSPAALTRAVADHGHALGPVEHGRRQIASRGRRALDSALKAQMPVVRDYFAGVVSTGGRPVAVYGSFQVVESVVGAGLAHCGWQCAAWSGQAGPGEPAVWVPAYGFNVRRSRYACLFQFYGAPAGETLISGTDMNLVLEDTTAAPASALIWHPNQPAPQEDDMAGPVIYKTKPNSDWAVITAGLQPPAGVDPAQPGDWRVARFIGYPSSGIMVRLHDDAQLQFDHFVGLQEIEADDPAFWNYSLQDTNGRAAGPQLAQNTPDSPWSREAGFGPGEQHRFLLWPSGLIVRVHDDAQFNVDRFVGVRDAGVLADAWFYNGSLAPWVLTAGTVDAGAVAELVATRVEAHLANDGIALSLSEAARQALVGDVRLAITGMHLTT
jgi:hypothetical protein